MGGREIWGGTSTRLWEFLSAHEFTNSRGRGTLPVTFWEARNDQSKNRRGDRLDKRVRKSIEEERAPDKSKEDEVVNSSDDSLASDPPSFTGVTSAADIERKKKTN